MSPSHLGLLLLSVEVGRISAGLTQQEDGLHLFFLGPYELSATDSSVSVSCSTAVLPVITCVYTAAVEVVLFTAAVMIISKYDT